MGMLGYLFPLCRRTPLRLRLEESMKRCSLKDYVAKPRDVNKPGMFFAVAQLIFHVEKEARALFRFLKLVILTSSWTRFHCWSREARALTAVLTYTNHEQDHAGLLAWSSVAHCHLFLNNVDSISSKDIDSAESSLEGIYSSDEERRPLFTGGGG